MIPLVRGECEEPSISPESDMVRGTRTSERIKVPKAIRMWLLQCAHSQPVHTISYQFLPSSSGGDVNQQVGNLKKSVSVLQQQQLSSCSRICGAVGGLKVMHKEELVPRKSHKQAEKSFNGGTVLVLG